MRSYTIGSPFPSTPPPAPTSWPALDLSRHATASQPPHLLFPCLDPNPHTLSPRSNVPSQRGQPWQSCLEWEFPPTLLMSLPFFLYFSYIAYHLPQQDMIYFDLVHCLSLPTRMGFWTLFMSWMPLAVSCSIGPSCRNKVQSDLKCRKEYA